MATLAVAWRCLCGDASTARITSVVLRSSERPKTTLVAVEITTTNAEAVAALLAVSSSQGGLGLRRTPITNAAGQSFLPCSRPMLASDASRTVHAAPSPPPPTLPPPAPPVAPPFNLLPSGLDVLDFGVSHGCENARTRMVRRTVAQ